MLKFNEEFIKNYDQDSDKGYILEVDVKYPKTLHGLHEDIQFLPERMKIGKCYYICYSHKIIKTSLKSCADIKEGS